MSKKLALIVIGAFLASLFTCIQAPNASAGTYVGPSAPLSVTQTSNSSGITLSWSAPSSGTPASYVIEKSTNGLSWSSAGTTSGSTRTITVSTGLSPSTFYYFRVAAISAAIQGPFGYPWVELYRSISPNRDNSGNAIYVSGYGIISGQDGALTSYISNYGTTAFSRIRYRIETTVNSVSRYADVDFEKWTAANRNTATGSNWDPDVYSVRIPSTVSGQQYVVHANITDMTIDTNSPDVRSGFGISGRLEIWPWNYAQTVSGLSPAGDTSLYDYDDSPAISSGNYGSFQVHTLEDREPVFVWNRHTYGQNSEIGYGNRSTGNPDWTFCGDAAGICTPSSFKLSIFLNPPITTAASLVPVISSSSIISGTTKYLETLTASTGSWSNTPTSYSYQWSRSGTAGGTFVAIPGATASTYRLNTADVGQFIKVAVTASNAAGSSPDTSSATSQISKANQAINLVSLGTSSKTYPYSQALSMSTSGSSGTGAITFTISSGGSASNCLLSDSSSIATLTSSSAGTCNINATIAADANYESATSSSIGFTFSRANQTLTFSTTSYSKSYNETQAVIASGSGSGAVTYSVGSSTACNVNAVSGIVTITSASGTCTITASIAQDLNFNSANSSNSVSITVSAASTTASVSIASGSLFFRTTKAITVVASVAGKITFRANNVVIPGCKSLVVNVTNSYTRICSFRPSTRGNIIISVTLVPTDSSYNSSVTRSNTYFVYQRSGTR